ncbi:MAG: thiopurine S-methyltransferase [Gammaproteobacteria bacterium]|nr:thiopurine S-methyltransferase [Gammaproteobacteria bacterium]
MPKVPDTDWSQRWREGRTGWHHGEPMPLLMQHWPALGLPAGSRVLVPLAGKSLDMLWLAQQGFSVLGVELSPLAVKQFFAENHLVAQSQREVDGMHYSAAGIEVIQGDIFKVAARVFESCPAVYDRAAIIALPLPLRQRYAHEVYGKLPPDCRGLMITLEYPQAEMPGPPFSVDATELYRLFDAERKLELLERRDILASQPGFKEAGVNTLSTAVYRLQRGAR